MADYVKTNWQNAPSTQTPINAENLNHIEDGIFNAQQAADQAQAGVDNLNGRSFAPVPVTLSSEMTETGVNYLYLGSEEGYDNGYLYYINAGGTLQKGNEYQAVQVITDKTLEHEGEPADAKAVGDEVTSIKSVLTVTTKGTVRALDFTTSADFTKVNGSAAPMTQSTGIILNKSGFSGSKYYTYYKQITEDADIYFNNIGSSVYFTLCVAVNCTDVTVSSSNIIFSASNGVRYRAEDSNLPTSASPITVHNGDYILITAKQSDTTHKTIYGLDGYDYDYSDRLKNDLMSRTIKRNACIYDSTASDDITEKLIIYLMAKGGYTKVPFCHSINDTTKLCDVWNIQPLYAVDDSFTDRFQISTTGEYECALRIEGASDFIGGTAHGDEYVTSVTVLIDGHNVVISDLTTLTEFDELKIVVNSNLISPFDHTTLVATHAKEYVFKDDEITINQVVEWKTAQTMDQSYMAMFPVAKAITPKVITDKKYEVRTLSVSDYFNETGTKKAISFSDDFVGTFGIGNWTIKGTNLTGIGKYVITDNGGHPYNKQYFCCCTSGTVADGDLWSTTTYYKFEH